MINRGAIRNREHSTQVIDYSGLRYGNITPTNIEGAMDFGGKAFIYLEYKYGDAPLPRGQELYFERQVEKLSVPAIVIVGSHNTHGDIDGANCRATRTYYKKWVALAESLTVREVIDKFLSFHDLGHYLS